MGAAPCAARRREKRVGGLGFLSQKSDCGTVALVVAAYQYRSAYRAEQASLLADAMAFAHWHGERGHDMSTVRVAWAQFEEDMR